MLGFFRDIPSHSFEKLICALDFKQPLTNKAKAQKFGTEVHMVWLL